MCVTERRCRCSCGLGLHVCAHVVVIVDGCIGVVANVGLSIGVCVSAFCNRRCKYR